MAKTTTTGHLAKTRRILHRLPGYAQGRVVFQAHNDDDGRLETEVTYSRHSWNDMGRPETITLTIEPGDHLNEAKVV